MSPQDPGWSDTPAGDTSSPMNTVLSPDDRAAVDRVETVSRLFDEAFRIPGTSIRFGLDPIAGILPIVGDTAVSFVSLYIVLEAYRCGAPVTVLAKMAAIVGVDVVVGSVPLLGTVFDTFWKANSWNASILKSYLERRPTRGRPSGAR